MERSAYQQMSQDEDTHWWFAARRDIISKLIETQLELPKQAEVLEAGCGTGGNLALLSSFGHLRAFEFDDQARKIAQAKSGFAIDFGALPNTVPYEDRSFHLIAMLDVLEHIDEDVASLKALGNKLRPGGSILITVPAMPWLWSHHDEIHHHKRRYTRGSLKETITAAGLKVRKINYFNTLLFPLAVGERFSARILGGQTNAASRPGEFVNTTLKSIFSKEQYFIGSIQMPFGLSLFAVAERTGT